MGQPLNGHVPLTKPLIRRLDFVFQWISCFLVHPLAGEMRRSYLTLAIVGESGRQHGRGGGGRADQRNWIEWMNNGWNIYWLFISGAVWLGRAVRGEEGASSLVARKKAIVSAFVPPRDSSSSRSVVSCSLHWLGPDNEPRFSFKRNFLFFFSKIFFSEIDYLRVPPGGLGTFGSHPKIGLTKSRDFVSTRWWQFWTRMVTWLLFHQSERSSNSIEHIQLEKMLKPSTWMLLIRVVGQCYVGIFYLNYFKKKKTKRVAPRPAIFPPSSFLMEFFFRVSPPES